MFSRKSPLGKYFLRQKIANPGNTDSQRKTRNDLQCYRILKGLNGSMLLQKRPADIRGCARPAGELYFCEKKLKASQITGLI